MDTARKPVTNYSRQVRLIWTTVACAAVAGIAYVINPLTFPLYPPCLLHRWTGLNCPGCGAGRALHELAQGHVLAALRLNALFVLALPLIGYYVLCGKRPGSRAVWIWVVVGVIVGFGVLRNIPLYPFTLLAPAT